MLNKQELLDLVKKYPLLNQCFSKYIVWICDNVQNNYQEYDLIKCLTDSKEIPRLEIFEKSLNLSQKILNISTKEFRDKFRFNKDILNDDPDTIHDILAETLFVLDLGKNNFHDIQKLPNSIKTDKNKIPNSDFIATYKNHKYAIEIKTIRIEDKSFLANNNLSVDISKEYWWGKMFLSNAITKIESNKRHLFDQLNNTCKYYNCDKRMLVLYVRRLGTSSLMDIRGFHNEFKTLKEKYPIIDCFSVKTYFGEVYFSCNDPCFTTFKSI